MSQGESAGDARVLRETQARRPKPDDDVGTATPRTGLSEPAAAPRRAPGDGGAAGRSPSAARSCSPARAGDDCAAWPAARGAEGAASGRLQGSVSPRALPPEDTCVTRRTPAPLRLKVYFWWSRCTPKGSLCTPRVREASEPGDRPLPAQLSPPPAGSFHFLTAKSPRGAPLPPPPLRPRTPPRAA